jgi:hypothetical protein
MVNKKASILLTVILLSTFSLARAKEKPIEQMNAREIYLKYRHMKPMEPQSWNTSKSSDGLIKLDNKFFIVKYPKCLTPVGDSENDDPLKSPSIGFNLRSDCKSSDINRQSTTLGIGRNGGGDFKNLEEAIGDGVVNYYYVKTPSLKWIAIAEVFDHISGKGQSQVDLRWQAYSICRGHTFVISVAEALGSPSLERVKNNKLSPPEFFKQIVSTFQCK